MLFTGARGRLQQSHSHLGITLSSVATRLSDEKPSTATTHLKIIEICDIFQSSNTPQATVSIHQTFSKALLRVHKHCLNCVVIKGEVSGNLPMQESDFIASKT